MIQIGEHTILMLASDGRSVPFDPADLQRRLENAMQGTVDKKELVIAGDIVSSVEMLLYGKFKDETAPCLRAEELDDLVVRVLAGAGFRTAADAFRRDMIENGGSVRIPLDKIRGFLEEKLGMQGAMLDRIAEKVHHTMQSIGADDSSPALALELARHFRSVAAGNVTLNVQRPDFTPDRACTVTPDVMLEHLSGEHRSYFKKRILKVSPVNLRILPALRLEVWLHGLAENAGLSAPLTEMALIPAFIRAAQAFDALCLAADEQFRLHGNTADTPAKVLLHLSDASLFTRNWMGCNSVKSSEDCAENLCRAFACEMTRIPFKMTCN